jgi:3-carboxy-cis,cis-muconate cycloisomerase
LVWSRGYECGALFAADLGLPLPDVPWQLNATGVASIASALGAVAGAMLKIAGDIVSLSQTEVGEVSIFRRPQGLHQRCRTSITPDATIARAARHAMGAVPTIVEAMDAEHERAAGSPG